MHDILPEKVDGTWRMRVSAYPKLRLALYVVVSLCEEAGLTVTCGASDAGMIYIAAWK